MPLDDLDFGTAAANDGETLASGLAKVQALIDACGDIDTDVATAAAAAAATSVDALQTAADRVQTGIDRAAAAVSAGTADTAAAYDALTDYADFPTTFGVTAASGSTIPDDRITFAMEAAPRTAYLTKVDAWVMVLGTGAVIMMVGRPRANANYDIVHKIAISGIGSTGALSLVAGTDFPDGMLIPEGAFVALGSATGGVQFAAAVAASTYVSSSVAGINASVNASTLTLKATMTLLDASTIQAAVAGVEAEASQANYATASLETVSVATGRNSPVSGDQHAGQDDFAGGMGVPMLYAGWLTGVQYTGIVAGDMDFEVWTSGGVYVDGFRATLVAAANQTALPPTPIKVQSDWLLFRRPAGGRVASYNDAYASGWSITAGGNSNYLGATFVAQTTVPNIRPIISRVVTVKEQISEQSRDQTLLPGGREFFPSTSTPTNWTIAGIWSVNNGLLASGSGGLTHIAKYDKFSNAQRKTTIMRVKLNTITSKFGFVFVPQDINVIGYGTVALLDASGGAASAVLKMYGYTGSALVGSGRSVAVPFTLVANRDYVLKLRKLREKNIFSVTDTVTGDTISLTVDQAETVDSSTETPTDIPGGIQAGKAGMVFYSGDIKVKMFERFTDVKQAPKWIWFGDSNSEGTHGVAQAYQLAYVNLLEDYRGKGDTLSVAKSAASADSAEACFALDLTPFSPQYAVWNLGTNPNANSISGSDADRQAALATSTANFITAALARDAIPVLVCPPPYHSNSSRILLQRTAIVGYTYGNYPFIDFTFPLSASLDGVDFPDAYTDAGDGLHLSYAGHRKAFAQILIDAPYLA